MNKNLKIISLLMLVATSSGLIGMDGEVEKKNESSKSSESNQNLNDSSIALGLRATIGLSDAAGQAGEAISSTATKAYNATGSAGKSISFAAGKAGEAISSAATKAYNAAGSAGSYVAGKAIDFSNSFSENLNNRMNLNNGNKEMSTTVDEFNSKKNTVIRFSNGSIETTVHNKDGSSTVKTTLPTPLERAQITATTAGRAVYHTPGALLDTFRGPRTGKIANSDSDASTTSKSSINAQQKNLLPKATTNQTSNSGVDISSLPNASKSEDGKYILPSLKTMRDKRIAAKKSNATPTQGSDAGNASPAPTESSSSNRVPVGGVPLLNPSPSKLYQIQQDANNPQETVNNSVTPNAEQKTTHVV